MKGLQKAAFCAFLAAVCLLTGCGGTGKQADSAAPGEETVPAAETPGTETPAAETPVFHTIPNVPDISPADGADSVEHMGDCADSVYFAHPDYYNMESTDTRTILTHFETMQQTSEWSCGLASTMMVLNWYGKLGDWNEQSLADFRHSLDGTELEGYPGMTLNQGIDVWEGIGGFDLVTTKDYPDGITGETIKGWLAEGKPIMVAWCDYGGHWQVIIGYDDMGTEYPLDDVVIVADPYDATDHWQDGYGTYGANRFLGNFSMWGYFPESEGGSEQLFIVATPAGE